MPKPPITLPIARSKCQSACHAALALGLCSVSSGLVPVWWVAILALCTVYVVWCQYQAQPNGELRLVKTGTQLLGRWLLANGELSDERPVRCDYIGPWLLGLYVGSQRVWLWPDSLPAHSHRALRRLCHRAGR